MRTTFAAALLATAFLLVSTPANVAAQARSWSDPTGFHVGLNAGPASIEYDADTQTDSGPAFGLTAGWGIINLITAYIEIGGANLDGLLSGDPYAAANFDIGARFNILDKGKKVRPYALAAFTGVATDRDIAGAVQTIAGSGLALGGGVTYFFSRKVAVDAGFKVSSVTFTEADRNGVKTTIDLASTATRFTVGMNYWHGYR